MVGSVNSGVELQLAALKGATAFQSAPRELKVLNPHAACRHFGLERGSRELNSLREKFEHYSRLTNVILIVICPQKRLCQRDRGQRLNASASQHTHNRSDV